MYNGMTSDQRSSERSCIKQNVHFDLGRLNNCCSAPANCRIARTVKVHDRRKSQKKI